MYIQPHWRALTCLKLDMLNHLPHSHLQRNLSWSALSFRRSSFYQSILAAQVAPQVAEKLYIAKSKNPIFSVVYTFGK